MSIKTPNNLFFWAEQTSHMSLKAKNTKKTQNQTTTEKTTKKHQTRKGRLRALQFNSVMVRGFFPAEDD